MQCMRQDVALYTARDWSGHRASSFATLIPGSLKPTFSAGVGPFRSISSYRQKNNPHKCGLLGLHDFLEFFREQWDDVE